MCVTRRVQFTNFYIIGVGNKSEKRNSCGSGCEYLIYGCVSDVQGGSNMTGTDLYVNKPHCAAAVRP